MKNIYTSLMMLLITCAYNYSFAQTYSFSKSTSTYTDITSGTAFMQSPKFSDTIALGFNFKIAGATGSNLYISVYGTISSSGALITSPSFETFSTEHAQGNYTYTISGAAGSRIVKLQYKNVKFPHDFTSSDYMNYQIWLYEADKSIEVHFGVSSVTHPDESYYPMLGGPAIGTKGFWLKGPANAPTTDTTTGTRITGTPPNGTVYKFTPASTGINKTNTAQHLTVYPIPVQNKINIRTTWHTAQPFTVSICDIQGRIISQWTEQACIDYTRAIPVDGWASGNYILKLTGSKDEVVRQFSVQ